MADGHEGHGHGPGEACHDSAHDHDASWERGAEMSLYRVVDVPRARALNTADPTHVPIFKPWDQRLDVLRCVQQGAPRVTLTRLTRGPKKGAASRRRPLPRELYSSLKATPTTSSSFMFRTRTTENARPPC